jgi:hypothetical protein
MKHWHPVACTAKVVDTAAVGLHKLPLRISSICHMVPLSLRISDLGTLRSVQMSRGNDVNRTHSMLRFAGLESRPMFPNWLSVPVSMWHASV